MTPGEFAAKWRGVETSERASAQSHFLDLCAMLGEPEPTEADPTGTTYAFEKALEKTVGGGGFADVWKRDFFGWEYKGKRKDLKAAHVQLLEYREALGNPPLLVVSDLDSIEIRTNFTSLSAKLYTVTLDDVAADDPSVALAILRAVFTAPEELRPRIEPAQITEKAARHFIGWTQYCPPSRRRGGPVPVVGGRGSEVFWSSANLVGRGQPILDPLQSVLPEFARAVATMQYRVGFPRIAPTLGLFRGEPTTDQGAAGAIPAGLEDLVQGRRGTHQQPWGAVRWSEALHRDAIKDECTAELRSPTMIQIVATFKRKRKYGVRWCTGIAVRPSVGPSRLDAGRAWIATIGPAQMGG